MQKRKRNLCILALLIGVPAALLLSGFFLGRDGFATTVAGAPLARPEQSSSSSEKLLSQDVSAFVMRWPTRSIAEMVERTHVLAEVFARRSMSAEPVMTALRNAATDTTQWVNPFTEMPDLVVRYIPNVDEIHMLNLSLSNTETDVDVGQDKAHEVMRAYFSELVERGVLRAEDFDLDKVRVSYTRSGSGDRVGSQRTEWVEEYRFTLLRQLNGIDVANAGLTFGIHRSGELSSIRLGGVEVESTRVGRTEIPIGEGARPERHMPRSVIEERFKAETPTTAQVRVIWDGLMYVMPEGVAEAVVEPMHVYSYTLTFRADDDSVVSRRKTVGYSVTDPGAAAIDFSSPSSPLRDPKPQDPKPIP